jgi:hypothetical protein
MFSVLKRLWKPEPQPEAKTYQKLQRYWTKSNAGILTVTHSENEVAALESRYGVRLPDDFREYLLQSCPSRDEEVDDRVTSWWGLSRIKNIPDEYCYEIGHPEIAANAHTYLFFADYIFWSMAWAIACGEDENRGCIIAISGEDRFVANNFREFVERYVIDDRDLF